MTNTFYQMVKLKSFFKKLFFGECLLEKINSPVNGEIEIYDGWFGRSMRVGGMTQSGELVEKLWSCALCEIQNTKHKTQNTLILGLGCGDAAKLISQKWPEAHITGVEIDPMVVEVGKRYFELSKIKNLEIVVGDAIEYVENPNHQPPITKYNLVLVDLYLGREYPKEAESEDFINGVKNVLVDGGIAIFNRLSYGDLENEAVTFSEKLRNFFPKVWTKKAITNLLIFCGL